MLMEAWLDPRLVLLQLPSSALADVVRQAARALAAAAGRDDGEIQAAFLEALRGEGFSLGNGVVIPHIEMDGPTTFVCLVTTAEPLLLPTVDGQPPDILLFILSRPDPKSHLLLLAHLARLTQSRTLLEGIRRARLPAEVQALVEAAELRHKAAQPRAKPVAASSGQVLVLLSASGEKLVDALLIELVDQGFGDACLLEAQSLREAATREVPIFAGFRDLFGDPGGRRVVLIEASATRTDDILGAVERICEDHAGSGDVRVSVVATETWHMGELPAAVEKAGGP